MDKISVIIPVYNVEKYISKCVESVMAQSYDNLEIILVNDGATDQSGVLCDYYAQQDSRIIVIHKENGGLSDARNCGLDRATGNYVLFFDADDYMMSEMLQILYEKLQQDDSDMVICGFWYVDESGEVLLEANEEAPLCNEVLNKREAISKLEQEKNWYYVVVHNKLCKRKLLTDLQFPIGKNHEDEYLIHHIMDRCQKISCMSKRLYYYVQRPDSITGKEDTLQRLEISAALLDRAEYAIKNNFHRLLRICLNDAINIVIECCNKNSYFSYREKVRELQREGRKILFSVLKSSVPVIEKIRFYVFCFSIRTLYFIHNIRRRKKLLGLKKKISRIRPKGENCIFLMTDPEHGNLGDHAILSAEMQLLKEMGLSKHLILIGYTDYMLYRDVIFEWVMPDDLILITGGGNMGTVWPRLDDIITEIIATYYKNPIIVFPQTCYYTDGILARKRILRNKEIYLKAEKLKVFLRDRTSYEFFHKNFWGVESFLAPDIVTMLKPKIITKRNNLCLLCLRDDRERDCKMSADDFIRMIEENGMDVQTFSTVSSYAVNAKRREPELKRIFSQIASARLVVTDRMHTMLFSAILGIPCICMDNTTNKIKGQTEWLQHLDYICLVSENEFEAALKKYAAINCVKRYDNEPLRKFYELLKGEILKSYNGNG